MHGKGNTDNPRFDSEGMSEAVSHANQITSKFGVEIICFNIISANPVDDNLTASLATGAVACMVPLDYSDECADIRQEHALSFSNIAVLLTFSLREHPSQNQCLG